MELKSKKVTVQKSATDLCNYLADVKNFESLMPENISKFEMLNEKAFIFAIDKEGNEVESITRETKNSPLGNEIRIKATGPKMTLNQDGSYELQFTPENTGKGNWFLESSTSLILQLVTKKGTISYNMLKSAAEMFGKTLKLLMFWEIVVVLLTQSLGIRGFITPTGQPPANTTFVLKFIILSPPAISSDCNIRSV